MESVYLTLLEFTDRLVSLQTPEEIWGTFVSFANRSGFQFARYLDLPAPGEHMQGKIIYNSAPNAWNEHYARNNYILKDPRVLHLLHTVRPYILDDVLSCPNHTQDQLRILDEAREFGVKGIYDVPLRSPQNTPAMIGLAGENSAPAPDQRIELHLAAIYTDALLRPPAPPPEALPPLTEREHECLQWAAIGKSDHDIGEILGISEKTVNFHIESAKRRYGVSSRVLAAAMAVRAGVVHL